MSAQKKSTTYVKDGVTHQKPVRKTKYEKHGYPYPNHLDQVDTVLLDLAKDMATNCKGIMIKYLRDYNVGKIVNEEGKIIGNRVIKGAPWAALVAFKNDNDEVLVGWSKRHSGKAYKIDGKTIPAKEFNAGAFANGRTSVELAKAIKLVDIEPLHFTKKDAILVALLRAMTDKIMFNNNKKTIRTANGSFLPKCIERAIPGFIQRVESYFKTKAVNIV